MKLGFICPNAAGHLNPITALARQLQTRNHDVVFLYSSGAAGLPFVPGPDEDHIDETIAEVSKLQGEEALKFSISWLMTQTATILKSLPAIVQANRVDALVIDTVQFYSENGCDAFGHAVHPRVSCHAPRLHSWYASAKNEIFNIRWHLSTMTSSNLTPEQQKLHDLWERHLMCEFATHDTEEALATMGPDAYVNHIPVLTGGVGLDELREFYSKKFIPQMPPDTEMTPISRTIGNDQLVDEMIAKFTHTIRMDWMLPGLEPTGKRVEVPVVAVVRFRDGKLAHEHVYWDQASVLVQLGLIGAASLPVAGIETVGQRVEAGSG